MYDHKKSLDAIIKFKSDCGILTFCETICKKKCCVDCSNVAEECSLSRGNLFCECELCPELKDLIFDSDIRERYDKIEAKFVQILEENKIKEIDITEEQRRLIMVEENIFDVLTEDEVISSVSAVVRNIKRPFKITQFPIKDEEICFVDEDGDSVVDFYDFDFNPCENKAKGRYVLHQKQPLYGFKSSEMKSILEPVSGEKLFSDGVTTYVVAIDEEFFESISKKKLLDCWKQLKVVVRSAKKTSRCLAFRSKICDIVHSDGIEYYKLDGQLVKPHDKCLENNNVKYLKRVFDSSDVMEKFGERIFLRIDKENFVSGNLYFVLDGVATVTVMIYAKENNDG